MSEQKTCTTDGCNETPDVRVFWPGKSPPPEYCLACSIQAMAVAKALGCVVHSEPITVEKSDEV